MVRQIRLADPLGDVLEAEGQVLEPVGAVLALLLLELVLGNLRMAWARHRFAVQLGGGVLIGAAVGWLLSELLRRLSQSRPPVFRFSSVWVCSS